MGFTIPTRRAETVADLSQSPSIFAPIGTTKAKKPAKYCCHQTVINTVIKASFELLSLANSSSPRNQYCKQGLL
jgi:hypothetical protein